MPASPDRWQPAKVAPSSAGHRRSYTVHVGTDWVGLGGLIWLAVTLLVLLWTAAGQLEFRRLCRGARPFPDEDWRRLAEQVSEVIRLRRRVALLQTDDHLIPLTWGWRRPKLLLRAEAGQWPEERRRLVLLHELAHVKRGDVLTQGMARLACAFWRCNP